MTTTLSEFDQLVSQMTAMGIPQHKAEREARHQLGIVPKSELERIREEAEVAQLEDDVVEEGDRMVRALGFTVIRLSQKRASKVTAGVPDRYYLHPRRKLALWWEAKASTGRARPEQLQFQQLCHDTGVHHVLGGLEQLREWLTWQRVATFDETGLPQPIRSDDA